MGRANAAGMAEAVDNGLIELEDAVEWHLSANMYPPVPKCMVEHCMAAIAAVNAEEYEEDIDVGDCGTHRVYGTHVPAGVLIESMHLEEFLDR